ncbi:GNAT family N-acetyltransferase [Cohnella sp. 56]|uniref:GNAT family N-acetyltransferase n=1 Tax=Cohnella sp. 56 TaxID=3113722 RepID=UPI0030E937B4
MELKLHERPDAGTWERALALYHQSFAAEGRKPDAVLSRMLERELCVLAVMEDAEELAAMAICGVLDEPKLLLIDYIAVRADLRGRGIGADFVGRIAAWAQRLKLRGLLIEAEADETPDNEARMRFWEKCGFERTSYVHQYIWVPEPYSAMIRDFDPDASRPADGRALFRQISNYHRRSFR